MAENKGEMKANFSFDAETKKLVEKLGYIPEDCYCTTDDVFIPEHAERNRKIVKVEYLHSQGKKLNESA